MWTSEKRPSQSSPGGLLGSGLVGDGACSIRRPLADTAEVHFEGIVYGPNQQTMSIDKGSPVVSSA
jgi:hypothetical protein